MKTLQQDLVVEAIVYRPNPPGAASRKLDLRTEHFLRVPASNKIESAQSIEGDHR